MIRRCARQDKGFTLIELMVVVMVIGILVSIAIPVFQSAQVLAATRTCFANQRELEGAVHVWRAAQPNRDIVDLAGTVNAAHVLKVEHFIGRPPTCPAAPESRATRDNPTVAEGAYVFDAMGHSTLALRVTRSSTATSSRFPHEGSSAILSETRSHSASYSIAGGFHATRSL